MSSPPSCLLYYTACEEDTSNSEFGKQQTASARAGSLLFTKFAIVELWMILERFVSTLEPDSGLLQVLPDFFAVCREADSGRTPLVKGVLEVLAADAEPVCFEHSGVVLDLRLKLCGDLLIFSLVLTSYLLYTMQHHRVNLYYVTMCHISFLQAWKE